MAQRNPLNDRYRGEGPAGKTKKSASSAKPKTEAASSVHIEKKPTNKRERKAAQKRRESEQRRKEDERIRRAKEKEQAARLAAGLEPLPAPKKGFLSSLLPAQPSVGSTSETNTQEVSTKTAAAKTSPTAASSAKTASAKPGPTAAGTAKTGANTTSTTKPSSTAASPAKPASTGFFSALMGTSKTAAPAPTTGPSRYPTTPEYKRLRKLYWLLMGVALIALVITMFIQMAQVELGAGMMIVLGFAYAAAIGAFVVHFVKIRPLEKAHNAQYSGGKKTPKQIKHESEAAAYARELQEARDAEKASRKPVRRTGALKSRAGFEEAVKNQETVEEDFGSEDEENI